MLLVTEKYSLVRSEFKMHFYLRTAECSCLVVNFLVEVFHACILYNTTYCNQHIKIYIQVFHIIYNQNKIKHGSEAIILK